MFIATTSAVLAASVHYCLSPLLFAWTIHCNIICICITHCVIDCCVSFLFVQAATPHCSIPSAPYCHVTLCCKAIVIIIILITNKSSEEALWETNEMPLSWNSSCPHNYNQHPSKYLQISFLDLHTSTIGIPPPLIGEVDSVIKFNNCNTSSHTNFRYWNMYVKCSCVILA